jgi:hypothetical protein
MSWIPRLLCSAVRLLVLAGWFVATNMFACPYPSSASIYPTVVPIHDTVTAKLTIQQGESGYTVLNYKGTIKVSDVSGSICLSQPYSFNGPPPSFGNGVTIGTFVIHHSGVHSVAVDAAVQSKKGTAAPVTKSDTFPALPLTVVQVNEIKVTSEKDSTLTANTLASSAGEGILYLAWKTGGENGNETIRLNANSDPLNGTANLWPTAKPTWTLEKPAGADDPTVTAGTDTFTYKATKKGVYRFVAECGNALGVQVVFSDFVLKVTDPATAGNVALDADDTDAPRPTLYVQKAKTDPTSIKVEMLAPPGLTADSSRFH